MSLQLIAGRSGSGKTTWLYEYMIRESMAHPDQKYIILESRPLACYERGA